MNKIFNTSLIVLGIALFCASPVFANDNLIVEFEDEPLFDEANFLPGESITRWVKVTNSSGQPQRIAVEAINYPGFISGSPRPHSIPGEDLSRALLLVIREKGGSDLYGGSTSQKFLYDFYQNGETYLSSISTGDTKEYEFEVTFSAEKEDKWQEKTTNFNILVGFQGTGGKVSPGGGGGGGGLPPGLTIQYEKDMWVESTTAKISWSTNYKSTSRVIYDTALGVFDLDNLPNYGYNYSTPEYHTPANTDGVTYHEVVLTGLESETTYYFRCISHGSFAVSTEHSFTTLSAIGEQEEEEEEEEEEEIIIVERETEQGIGEQEEEEEEEEEEKEGLLGMPGFVEIQEAGEAGLSWLLAAIGDLFRLENLWWLLLLLIIIIIILYWLSRKKKRGGE